MGLNIKNAETERLVRELAAQYKTSLVEAITMAVKEKLAQERTNPKAGLAEWLMKLSETTAPLMNDGRTSTELIEELYDPKTGLPK